MLAKYGYIDDAFLMATQEEAPSWGNWIKQGFTSAPETWVLSPEFRDASVNHVFLGDINAWMYQVLAGINYDENSPGFRNIIIRPYFPEGLEWVKAEHRSINGLIRSEWKRKDGNIELNITIPLNCTATVAVNDIKYYLPSGSHQIVL